MPWRDAIFGRPLKSSEESTERLSVITGVPVLGLDALASTGYGPEAGLLLLMPLGTAGLRYFPYIAIAIVLQLTTLYFSYRQTAAAYPTGGGAYVVVTENLGHRFGVWAAVSLLLDYLLNVAVGIASGIGAVVSAIPALHDHALSLCLVVLATLTLLNLRGVRELGLAFVVPVILFVVLLAVTMGLGIIKTWQAGGHPVPVAPIPTFPPAQRSVDLWILLAAFANGSTALTGIEAVSNGVPLFRKPSVPRAQRALTAIAVILGTFLLGFAYLCPRYRIVAMSEQERGYETVLSQLVAAVAGRHVFYYATLTVIFVVLTYSAQTSFADFPRVCRLLADDRFLPPAFANRGRRLVFTHGIVVLSVLSFLLLVAFQGNIDRIIPLFAVGAFSAFFFSQTGMVVHWLRRRGPGFRKKLAFNALGAVVTGVALVVIVAVKFLAGAWITVLVLPSAALLLFRIKRHYTRLAKELEEPSQPVAPRKTAVIVLVDAWNRVSEKALSVATGLSDDVTAVHVRTERDHAPALERQWPEMLRALGLDHEASDEASGGATKPVLVVLDSPYRLLHRPIVDFVERTKREKPDHMIAVLIPELASSRWVENVLHDLRGAAFRSMLYGRDDDRVVVLNVPWHLPAATKIQTKLQTKLQTK
jgi:amino acid transporter